MSSSTKLRVFLLCALIASLLISSCAASSQTQTVTKNESFAAAQNVAVMQTGSLYVQPVDPSGKLLLSAWLDPDGSDLDQYIWDNFTLPSNETITDIQWYGVYDPLKFGAGGPVLDFSVSIYPSIPAGTEPAIANPPLVQYQTGGNAGETQIGTFGTAPLYVYSFTLPTAFAAAAGVKYWVQIEASQTGTTPDWCLAPGAGGDASHFQRGTGAGGDIMYRTAPGDAAFTLLGPVPEVPTPTDTPTETPTDIPTDTPTDVVLITDTPTDTPVPTETATSTATDTATATNTATDTATSTATNTPTDTSTPTETVTIIPSLTPTDTATATNLPTETPTDTAIPTLTDIPTNTPTDTAVATATDTPTSTPTDTPVPTATYTPTNTPTETPVPTPTYTPTPLSNTPGKVTGGGTLGSGKDGNATFGFIVSYGYGDPAPKGNLTFQDHKANLKLKATSFDLLIIQGNQAWFIGTGIVNDRQVVHFTILVHVSGQSETFSIDIPALNGYSWSGNLSGGNITIH